MAGNCGFFISWMCLVLCSVTVCGDCIMEFTGNSPIIFKNFGSRRLTKKPHGLFAIKEGEQIDAFCPTGFQIIQGFDVSQDNTSHVQMRCDPSSVLKSYRRDSDYELQHTDRDGYAPTSCRSPVLYESQQALPSCGKNMSYAIGIAPTTSSNKIITAGICYDLNLLSLRYVNYVAQRRKSEILFNQLNLGDLQNVSLDKEISNMDTFFSFISRTTFLELLGLFKRKQPLMNAFDFDYTNLVRDAGLDAELKGFEYIFNTIWWRNLRLGNWQLYLDALEERTRSVQYLVYMGTSGVVAIPKSSYSSPELLAVEAHGITVNAPAFIWAHLRSLGGAAADASAEEFVVIANNSPFNSVYDGSTFCEDICDEIDWLRSSLFGKVRLLSTMGVVFCCRPEEVAGKLENFPVPLEPHSTTMKPVSTTKHDVTDEVTDVVTDVVTDTVTETHFPSMGLPILNTRSEVLTWVEDYRKSLSVLEP